MFNIPKKKPSIELKEKKEDVRSYCVLPIRAALDKSLTPGDLRTLMQVASYASRGGYTFVSVRTIGKFSNRSPQAVSVAIKRLERKGYIETIRKGYTGMRGSLKRIIFDDSLSIDDVISISNDAVEQPTAEYQTMRKRTVKPEQSKSISVDNTLLAFDDAVLVVSHALKSESDLLRLERLVSQGCTRVQLEQAFK
jgi:DNA-binding Lrp family transcriptional regulator